MRIEVMLSLRLKTRLLYHFFRARRGASTSIGRATVQSTSYSRHTWAWAGRIGAERLQDGKSPNRRSDQKVWV